jgi:hypothetical protein
LPKYLELRYCGNPAIFVPAIGIASGKRHLMRTFWTVVPPPLLQRIAAAGLGERALAVSSLKRKKEGARSTGACQGTEGNDPLLSQGRLQKDFD